MGRDGIGCEGGMGQEGGMEGAGRGWGVGRDGVRRGGVEVDRCGGQYTMSEMDLKSAQSAKLNDSFDYYSSFKINCSATCH